LLHDIGKIAIDESVLNKEGRLTEAEWEAVRRHPEIGWRILGTVGELGELANHVLSHHERMDGTGYPQGLRGDDIPLQSRIISVVDAYDAMTAMRSYRKPVSDREAASELKRCSGTQFDATLARLFIEQILQLQWDEV
jgi:HD-GYP domain-containing protein (c-di-GMP phosphodiesterase class II)